MVASKLDPGHLPFWAGVMVTCRGRRGDPLALGRSGNGSAGGEAGELGLVRESPTVDPYGGAAAAHVLIRVGGFWPQKFHGP